MTTLALCMIAKNEEGFIAQAITSAKPICDEIIVLDTGSTDKTKEIAKNAGATVFDYTWQNDFAAAKNAAREKATADWILFLDADECLTENERNDIKNVLEKTIKDSPDAVAFSFVSRHYTKQNEQAKFQNWKQLTGEQKTTLVENNEIFTQFVGYYDVNYITRLFKNDKNIFFQGHVHEDVNPSIIAWNKAEPEKTIVRTDMPIHHLHFAKEVAFIGEKQKSYYELSKQKIKQGFDAKIALDLAVGSLVFENNKKEMFKWLTEIIKQQENFEEQHMQKIQALLEAKKEIPAMHILISALDLRKHDANSVFNLVKALYKAQEYKLALVILKRLFLLAPKESTIIEYMAVCYDKINLHNDAIKILEHGIAVHPTNAEFYFKLGALYEKIKEYSKAAAAFQYAINNEHPMKAQLQKRLAMLKDAARGQHVKYTITMGDETREIKGEKNDDN